MAEAPVVWVAVGVLLAPVAVAALEAAANRLLRLS